MKADMKMYNYLRKYLSPYVSYRLVKEKYPKVNLGLADMELERLRLHFERRKIAGL